MQFQLLPNPSGHKVSKSNTFDLLGLPAELREEIYKLALTTSTPLCRPTPDNTPSNLIALLQANKQIHNEAKVTFYKQNTFSFETAAAFLSFAKGKIHIIRRIRYMPSQEDITGVNPNLVQLPIVLENCSQLRELEIGVEDIKACDAKLKWLRTIARVLGRPNGRVTWTRGRGEAQTLHFRGHSMFKALPLETAHKLFMHADQALMRRLIRDHEFGRWNTTTVCHDVIEGHKITLNAQKVPGLGRFHPFVWDFTFAPAV